MGERIADLAAKIELVLKVLNLSRGRLASLVGVDKSLVGRWVSGAVHPSGHNLTLVTEIVRRSRPTFDLLAWEQDLPTFGTSLGAVAKVEVSTAAAPSWQLKIAQASRREVAWEGGAYPGLYHSWRLALNNSGIVVRGCVMVTRIGDDLEVRETEGLNEHRGPGILNRGQLYAVMEEEERQDGMYFFILNGVGTGRALLMDGIILTVCSIRTRPPGAATVVLERCGDLTGDPAVDGAAWLARKEEARAVQLGSRGRELVPPRILAQIENRVGLPHVDGSVDTVLRVPHDRSLSMCEADREAMAEPPRSTAPPAVASLRLVREL